MNQKLLFISHMAELTGGGEKSLLSIILWCKSAGYACHVILPGAGSFAARLAAEEIPYTVLTYKWSEHIPDDGFDPNREENLALHIANTMLDFETVISETTPDVLITNTLVVPWGLYIAKAQGIPTILFVREWVFGEDEMKMVPDNEQYMALLAMCADHVIFNSKDMQAKYAGYFANTITSVMYPDVGLTDGNIKNFYKENNIGKMPSVLVAGVFAPHKNQIEAVRGIRAALDMGIEIGDVLFVGKSGAPDYYQELTDEIKACGLAEKIKVQDFAENFFEIVNSYNIVLVPSKSEPFGRITLEAQLFGRLVIGSRSGATAELIEDKKTGLLYSQGDAVALAEALKWAVDNPREAENIGKRAQEAQLKNFAHAELMKPLETAINEVLNPQPQCERDRSFDPLFATMSKIHSLEKEIEDIRNSKTFKAGNALISPFRRERN